MTKPFAHLHVHSEYSILDGLGRQGDYLNRAVEFGHPALAFTEHGSMRGAYKLHENVSNMDPSNRPWPIYGCEFYVCEDRKTRGLQPDEVERIRATNKGRKAIGDALYKRELELGLRQRYHLTVLAKSQEGIANLFRLTSIGWMEGFWKRPRIDLETLERHREGLIVLSGCSGGVVPQLVVDGNIELADKRMEWLVERFGEDLYMEIMPTSYPDQTKVNKAMLRYSRRFNRPLVATCDAHYIRKEHVISHELLLCIRTHDVLSDPNRFRFSTTDFWFRDYAEMMDGFQTYHPYIDRADVRRALATTLEIAEKCQARLIIDRFKALVPSPGLPAKYKGNEFAFITDLCWTGWESRDMFERVKRLAAHRGVPYKTLLEQYMERLKYELAALKRQNVVSYFLVIWDMYRWAKDDAKIVCGPGRGSAGGCLVSYLLRITDTDPIEHGLLFERFLNPDRIDLPDIDCDFEDERRDEVIQYLRRKYGPDKTAQISTITTLKGKQCIRDISRALEIPFSEVDEVTSSVIERSSGDERASQTIEDSFKDFDVCRKFNERHPEVLQHARILESHARGLGVHAAGIVVSPKPLTEIIPMETRERAGVTEVVTGMEMWGVQGMGLVKIDLLGLRNLTVIKHCLEAIKERHGVEVDLNSLDLNDPKVLANFTAHAYSGVFQFDTPSADKITDGVEFTTFEDVVAMIALDRPGTARSGLAAEYLKRKKDPTRIRTVHPVIDAICADTYGVIVYQEHVIKMFTDVAGFAPGTADSLRKKIAKKFGDAALGKERENFIKGATARGFDSALAAKIMDQITFFGCLSSDTEVSTPNGPIPIRRLRDGGEVLSWDGERQVRNRIKTVGPSGSKQLTEVVLSNGRSVLASDGHFFLCADGVYRKTVDLTLGMELDFAPGSAVLPLSSSGTPNREACLTVVALRPTRVAPTFDLETENEPHNYVLGCGAISHNSYGFNKTIWGSSVVHRAGANASSKAEVTIAELYAQQESRDGRGWLTSIAQKMRYQGVKILRMEPDGCIRPGRVVKIHDHGIHRVFRLEAESGRWVKATGSHRFATPDGFRTLGTLRPGDVILMMGENTSHDYCSWWMNREEQEGRMSEAYKGLRQAVRERAKDKCEECGATTVEGRGGHELAHLKTPAELDYNRKAYHSLANTLWLCNSCHKALDYKEGKRTKRWLKGRPVVAEKVVSVETAGSEHCFDIEMDGPEGHNYIANGFVSHNSHSTAYGLIGYWEMWLKTYYPSEFVWALLYCERDDVSIRRFVKECNRLGIRIIHPHVNHSKSRFTLDGADIVGSLIDVKGCGSIAAESIETNAPYKSFTDLLKRVDRRKVHKGVILALARAGALDGLIPNRKWFVENVENIWAIVGKAKWDDVEVMLAASKEQPAYTDQEAVWGAAEVCPLASGKHPMVPYQDMLTKTLAPDWVSMSDETLFDRRSGFLNGIIVEVKYNQIGDFHTGQLPDEDEKRRRRWGARYANINIEDLSGKNNRVKVDVDTFDVHRPIIDKGIGTPVAFHASIDGKWKSIRVHFMVALDVLRKKLDACEPLDVFERLLVRGRNPLKAYTKGDIERKVKDSKHSLIDVVGVVTHLNVKPDKKLNDMAFFGLLGYRGYIDVLCFASSWDVFQGKFEPGDIVSVRLERRDSTCFLERRYEDELKVLERRSSL